MRRLLVLAMALVFNLSNAQETYQYKGYGMEINYEFTEDSLFVSGSKIEGINKVPLVSSTELGKIKTFITYHPELDVKTRYQFVRKGNSGKYVMLMTSVDNFTGKPTENTLIVTKL